MTRRVNPSAVMLTASLSAAAILSACDPCAGTATCRTGAQISYTGHVVEHATERPAAGTVVTFTRTGGVELASNTIQAVSGSDGFFLLTGTARSSGDVVGTLHVAPAGRPSYDESNITLHTTNVAGDGGDLGRIVTDPYVSWIAEVRSRLGNSTAGVANATVVFKRTGGIQANPQVINTTTDPYGRFILTPTVAQGGTIEAVLTITAPGFPRSYDIPVRIDTRYQDGPTRDVAVLHLGAVLLWSGEIYRRLTNEHMAGIQVDFLRTGGIAVDPAQFTSITDKNGLFVIEPTPLAEGELIGTITIHPPAPYGLVTVSNVRIHTVADDTVRLAGRWSYGAQTYGSIEFRYRTTGALVDSGVPVVFRRTSGVATHPDSMAGYVNQFGSSLVQLPSDGAGDVIGDFQVTLGAQYGTEIIRAQHLPSLEDDIEHFYGTHLVGRWFPQVAQLIDSGTHQPIPGARVRFTRVTGILTAPDPYEVAPNADGYFGIRPQPLADGEVVGNLTFELPPPYTSTTVAGIHLRSSMDDTLRFIGAFSFAPAK